MFTFFLQIFPILFFLSKFLSNSFFGSTDAHLAGLGTLAGTGTRGRGRPGGTGRPRGRARHRCNSRHRHSPSWCGKFVAVLDKSERSAPLRTTPWSSTELARLQSVAGNIHCRKTERTRNDNVIETGRFGAPNVETVGGIGIGLPRRAAGMLQRIAAS